MKACRVGLCPAPDEKTPLIAESEEQNETVRRKGRGEKAQSQEEIGTNACEISRLSR